MDAKKTTTSSTVAPAGRSLWADAWRRIYRDRSAMVCLAIIVLYVLVALVGGVYEWIARSNPKDSWLPFAEMVNYSKSNQAPSWTLSTDIMGTDWSGHSVLLKTLLGAKTSLTVALMANVIAVPLGMLLGALAGYFGKWLDDVIVWMYTTLLCIPGIILLIAMKYAFKGVSFWGIDLTGIHGVYIALGIISWVGTCRLVRAEVMKIRELDYVLAARATGRSSLSIMMRHVMPNVAHLGIIQFSLGFVGAIKAEVILSYLGLGVESGVPSWGGMIDGARMDLFVGRWWEITAAVAAMFFLVLALNIFGDRLRDAFDPKLRTV